MAGQKREARLHHRIPTIQAFAALEQVVDARVKPGHGELYLVPDAVQRLLAVHRRAGTTTMLLRDGPGSAAQRSRAAQHPGNEAPYSAGLAAGGGGAADGAAAAAFALAAFFSTMRTARIEPSYSASSGSPRQAWPLTSGGVRTAAMWKATTM